MDQPNQSLSENQLFDVEQVAQTKLALDVLGYNKRLTRLELRPQSRRVTSGGGGFPLRSVIAGTGLSGGGALGDVTLNLITPVAVSNGGTGTTTQFTAGSVVFAGTNGVYSQSNANFFWDNTNSRLGIGTASPGQGAFGGGAAKVIHLSDSSNAVLRIVGKSNVDTTIDGGIQANGQGLFVGAVSDHPLIFISNGNEYMRVGASNVNASVNVTASVTGANVLGLRLASALTANANGDAGFFGYAASQSLTVNAGVTVTNFGAVYLDVPSLTNNGTITNAAQIYIAGVAPSGTNRYAIFVDAGNSRFDGNVGFGGSGDALVPTHQISLINTGIDEITQAIGGSQGIAFQGITHRTVVGVIPAPGGVLADFSIYNSSTNVSSNYEILNLGWDSATSAYWISTFVAGTGTARPIVLAPGGTEKVRLSTNGRVGIGTTNPGALLDVGLAGTTLGVVRLAGSTSGNVSLQPNAVAGTDIIITLPATTGTVALTANNLSVFAATTSAQLAGVISDETGSGSLVFATSPTLVSPTLGVATATSLSTPSIITASGALTITPAAGSNLNVNLSTTGDFAVNTNQLYVDTSASNIGVSTTSPTNILSFGGNATRTIWMERHTVANTAGNNFTVEAGGATSGATNKNGGNLVLKSGLATGTGTSQIIFQVNPAGSSGTVDTTPTTAVTILGNGNVQFNETTYYDAEFDNGNSGAADTINWSVGNIQKSTLTGNVTYTFTAPGGPCMLTLKVIQDATGSRTVTWPAAVKWPGGVAPVLTTTANAIDIVTLLYDGTNYNGIGSGMDIK